MAVLCPAVFPTIINNTKIGVIMYNVVKEYVAGRNVTNIGNAINIG